MSDYREYTKINSIFKRDKITNQFIMGEWSTEELRFLQNADWDWTEKVDGTNIRLCLEVGADSIEAEYRGRTDNAQFSKPLSDALSAIMTDDGFLESAHAVFSRGEPVHDPIKVILYGEGYGAGIQKGGAYRSTPGFVLFDVLIDDKWWMPRETVVEMGGKLALDVVPYAGQFSLNEAIDVVRSTYEPFESEWPGVEPEGLVGVPSVPLFDHKHHRIITKVKVRDFAHLDKELAA